MAFEKGNQAFKARKGVGKRTRVPHKVRCKNGDVLSCEITRAMAIKMLCTECLGWEDVPETCTSPMCPVYPFRGKTLRTQKGNIKKEDA